MSRLPQNPLLDAIGFLGSGFCVLWVLWGCAQRPSALSPSVFCVLCSGFWGFCGFSLSLMWTGRPIGPGSKPGQAHNGLRKHPPKLPVAIAGQG